MFAPEPVPFMQPGQLRGLARGDWLAQHEYDRLLYVPHPRPHLVSAAGAHVALPRWLAGRLKGLPEVELALIGQRVRLFDCALPGGFAERANALAAVCDDRIELQHRYLQSIDEINRSLRLGLGLGALGLLLKRWDAPYPISAVAPVRWLGCVRVTAALPHHAHA